LERRGHERKKTFTARRKPDSSIAPSWTCEIENIRRKSDSSVEGEILVVEDSQKRRRKRGMGSTVKNPPPVRQELPTRKEGRRLSRCQISLSERIFLEGGVIGFEGLKYTRMQILGSGKIRQNVTQPLAMQPRKHEKHGNSGLRVRKRDIHPAKQMSEGVRQAARGNLRRKNTERACPLGKKRGRGKDHACGERGKRKGSGETKP